MILRLLPHPPPTDAFVGWIEFAIRAIEGLAVAIIALSVFVFTLRYLYFMLVRRGRSAEAFTQYKHGLGKALLLALELLVAADVVQTVVLEFTLSNVAALGAAGAGAHLPELVARG